MSIRIKDISVLRSLFKNKGKKNYEDTLNRQAWRISGTGIMTKISVTVTSNYWAFSVIADADCISIPGVDGDCFQLFIWINLFYSAFLSFYKGAGSDDFASGCRFFAAFRTEALQHRLLLIWENVSVWLTHIIYCIISFVWSHHTSISMNIFFTSFHFLGPCTLIQTNQLTRITTVMHCFWSWFVPDLSLTSSFFRAEWEALFWIGCF